jgi:hypothetical protein
VTGSQNKAIPKQMSQECLCPEGRTEGYPHFMFNMNGRDNLGVCELHRRFWIVGCGYGSPADAEETRRNFYKYDGYSPCDDTTKRYWEELRAALNSKDFLLWLVHQPLQ